LIEKPKLQNAPSNLASIGPYVLTPDIFETLRSLPIGSGGEVQLADAINVRAKVGDVQLVRLNGERFDYGLVAGYIDAINFQFNDNFK